MTTTQELEREIDAIDWEAPVYGSPSEQEGKERNGENEPGLYEFIAEVAEIIPDEQAWVRFTAALRRYHNGY